MLPAEIFNIIIDRGIELDELSVFNHVSVMIDKNNLCLKRC